MRILIIDETGKQKEIDAKDLEFQGRTLIQFLRDVEEFKTETKAFINKANKREAELHELWRKIK